MPYFGKTQYSMLDSYGTASVAVYDYQDYKKDPILIAIEIGDLYIFTANDILMRARGKINFLQLTERLPATTKFSKSEDTVLDALVDWNTLISFEEEE